MKCMTWMMGAALALCLAFVGTAQAGPIVVFLVFETSDGRQGSTLGKGTADFGPFDPSTDMAPAMGMYDAPGIPMFGIPDFHVDLRGSLSRNGFFDVFVDVFDARSGQLLLRDFEIPLQGTFQTDRGNPVTGGSSFNLVNPPLPLPSSFAPLALVRHQVNPEPSTIVTLGIGVAVLGGAAFLRRRRLLAKAA